MPTLHKRYFSCQQNGVHCFCFSYPWMFIAVSAVYFFDLIFTIEAKFFGDVHSGKNLSVAIGQRYLLAHNNVISLFKRNVKDNGQGPDDSVWQSHCIDDRSQLFFSHEALQRAVSSNGDLFNIHLPGLVQLDLIQRIQMRLRRPFFCRTVNKSPAMRQYQ